MIKLEAFFVYQFQNVMKYQHNFKDIDITED